MLMPDVHALFLSRVHVIGVVFLMLLVRVRRKAWRSNTTSCDMPPSGIFQITAAITRAPSQL